VDAAHDVEFSYSFESVEIVTPVHDASGKFLGVDWETVIYDPEALVQPVRILGSATIRRAGHG